MEQAGIVLCFRLLENLLPFSKDKHHPNFPTEPHNWPLAFSFLPPYLKICLKF
jgi:hypothetical protein